MKDLDPNALKEVEAFFVSYNRLCGKKFKILRYAGRKAAKKLIDDGMKS
jgi:inorganic pyrophosphatase